MMSHPGVPIGQPAGGKVSLAGASCDHSYLKIDGRNTFFLPFHFQYKYKEDPFHALPDEMVFGSCRFGLR